LRSQKSSSNGDSQNGTVRHAQRRFATTVQQEILGLYVTFYDRAAEAPVTDRSLGKCGGKRVDVRPNWKEQPGTPDNWQGRPAWEE
jgi:hypothetical protein